VQGALKFGLSYQLTAEKRAKSRLIVHAGGEGSVTMITMRTGEEFEKDGITVYGVKKVSKVC